MAFQGQVHPAGQQPGLAQTTQPGAAPGTIVWMPKPDPIPGIPPGLEYLMTVNQLMVKQEVEMLEVMTGWETTNKYSVKNSMGQQVFYAQEESGECMRQCCSSDRGFVMHITDNFGQEVMRVTREFKCCGGCCWCAGGGCCAFEVSVEAPPGEVVGYVRQGCSFWKPKYEILDVNRDKFLEICGPCCMCQSCCCSGDEEFLMTYPNSEEEVGKISKKWGGLVEEMFTKADNFGISFPVNIDVRMKAVCLGAVFLIDFMHYEDEDDNNE